MTGSIPNRRPADRLAELRTQIAALKAEENALREGFIAGDLPLEGDEHVAVVEQKVNERIDLKAMRQNVDASIWSPYLTVIVDAPVRSAMTEKHKLEVWLQRDSMRRGQKSLSAYSAKMAAMTIIPLKR